jgi:hypothetical protein
MASLQSSLNHGLPHCFGFAEVFGIVSSAIDITVLLNFKIGSVAFRIVSEKDSSENILHRTISAISASSGRKLEEH